MIKQLTKLIDVKTIITLTVLTLMAVQILRGATLDEFFKTVVIMVISFYFGTQSEKNKQEVTK